MAEISSRTRDELRERFANSAIDWRAALSDLAASRDTGKLIIFVGSAASLFPPTCHPLGRTTSRIVHSHLLSVADNPTALEKETVCELPFEALFHFGALASSNHKMVAALESLYSGGEPNHVHQALVDVAVAANGGERTSGIVTTNYDTSIEDAAVEAGAPLNRIVHELDVKCLDDSSAPWLFKIHGCITSPESIVYELRQEARLKSWKVGLLQRLLADATVLFLGYSGVDYDIVPELMNIRLRSVHWNVRPPPGPGGVADDLPAQVCRLLNKFDGTLVVGDLQRLASRLAGRAEVARDLRECPDQTEVVEQALKEISLEEWKLWVGALLPAVGIPGTAEDVLRTLTAYGDEQEVLRLRSLGRARFHRGKYRQARRFALSAAREQRRLDGAVTTSVVECWLDAVHALNEEGRFVRSLAYLLWSSLAIFWIRRRTPTSGSEIMQTTSHLLDRFANHPFLRWSSPGKVFAMRAQQMASDAPDLYQRSQILRSVTDHSHNHGNDLGTSRSYDLIENWRRLGHVVGQIDAMRRLAIRLRESDPEAARELMKHARDEARRALNVAGDVKASYELAKMLPNGDERHQLATAAYAKVGSLEWGFMRRAWWWHKTRWLMLSGRGSARSARDGSGRP